jgi:hypothetical integral membrane protein (TIGR02206 family)
MQRFEPFGIQHLITIAGLAATIWLLCRVGIALRGSRHAVRYERALAAGVGLLWVGYQAYDTITNGFDPRWSLPLQLCDLAAIIAALAFAWPDRRLHALAWFWGLALSTQAVFTPDLTGGPGTLAFWAFWLYHAFVVGAGVYAVTVRGFRPRVPDWLLATLLAVAYAIVMFIVDAAFGLNYGYLGRATPSQPSLIDHLGPWPTRAVFMTGLGAAAMTLLWVPWAIVERRHARRQPADPGSLPAPS